MDKKLQEIYKGKNTTITMDLVPLTDEQLEELIKNMQIVEEIQEDDISKINGVLAISKGKVIKLDSNFNIDEIDGIYYSAHKRDKILFADITDWTFQEKDYLRKIIQNKLKMKNKRLIENDVVLPLQLSGRIKPKYL